MARAPSLGHVIGVLLVVVGTVEAYDKFETKCTIPLERVNFVTSPDTRGTLDILWNSLFTIFACTWTIQHLNVPEQRRGRDPGTLGDWKWRLKGSWRTTKWMLITILAPEIILGKAAWDLIEARKSCRDMKDFAAEDGVEWTMAHAFYANMGGFHAASDTSEVERQQENGEVKSRRENVRDAWNDKIIALTAGDLLWLRQKGHLTKLPQVPSDELNDKSKGDPFVKAITLIQVVFSVVQIIVRLAKGLVISQLELAVVAFAICAVITYSVLLQKPQNIRTALAPFYIDPTVLRSRDPDHGGFRFTIFFSTTDNGSQGGWFENKVPNDGVGYLSDAAVVWTLINFAGILFGSIHVAGWNLVAPAMLEQTLWRVASILMMACCFMTVLFWIVAIAIKAFSNSSIERLGYLILWLQPLLIISYILARLVILVEIFRSLYFLPPEAYVSTWATNVPHVG